MMKRLSQKLLIHKERTTEIDAEDEIMVANINPEELLVDFPTAAGGRQEEILVADFPRGGTSRSIADPDTRRISRRPPGSDESEDDVDDDGFLGFPTGGRNSFACRGTPLLSSTTYTEAASCKSLPVTIEFPTTDGAITTEQLHQLQNTNRLDDERSGNQFEKPSNWVGGDDNEETNRLDDERIDEKPSNWVGDDDDEDGESFASDEKEEIQKWVDEHGDAFEKPSNWVDDEESSDGNSEEYRMQIMQMARERRPSLTPANSLRDFCSKENAEPLPRRTARRSSMPTTLFLEEPAPSANENPFSAGFEFAKAVPVPMKQGRRPSLANTTYSFEKEAASRPSRQARRASMGTFKPKDDYADGLRAFGAKQHDIRHILT